MKTIERIEIPPGSIIVDQMGDRVWGFEYPRLEWEVLEEFHGAIDMAGMGDFVAAEELYRQLIDEYPEFIDVYHHLALLLSDTNRYEEAFAIWKEVVRLGMDCLPAAFEMGYDQLPWLDIENRPFLRAYHGLGLEYLERGEVEIALGFFNNLLAMNPNDNQGARALVIECQFDEGRPDEVLAVCDRYADDGMEQVLYGRALAMFQLGRLAEAEETLRSAIGWLPLVAKELVKSEHHPPEEMRKGYIIYGGADQAYMYWLDQGEYWENTPGALELVRRCLK